MLSPEANCSFCLDKTVIGSSSHFVCQNKRLFWADEVPLGVWHLNGTLKYESRYCLDSLFQLNKFSVDLSPPSNFLSAMKVVTKNLTINKNFMWRNILPKGEYKSYLKSIVNNVTELLKISDFSYYEQVWFPGNSVFLALKNSKIDVERYQSLIDQKVGNISVVKTFKPGAGGWLKPPVYNRFGTRTGRYTIQSGPGILTLKRDYRDLVTSRYGANGKIVILDFSNLEPRIILYEAGQDCPTSDLYQHLNDSLFQSRLQRDDIKFAVIAELYGISKAALQRQTKLSNDDVEALTTKIKTTFKTNELLSRIKNEYVKCKFVKNRYGRKIEIDTPKDNIFINSYTQSTGEAVALLGFTKIVNAVKDKNVKISPIFILADALILDVHKQDAHMLKQFKKIKVDGYIQKFPIKINCI